MWDLKTKKRRSNGCVSERKGWKAAGKRREKLADGAGVTSHRGAGYSA